MSLLRGCETGATKGATISVKAGSCLTDKRIASFDDRDNDDPSDDVTLKQCISGFVAGKDQAFINGLPVPFDQCCRCKPGEACELCEIPTNCTDKEKEKFVAQEACFGTEAGEKPKPVTKKGCPTCPPAKECWSDKFFLKRWWHGLLALIAAIILGFILGKML